MGAFTALAIAIHNFPEGLATFLAALQNPSLGVAIAAAEGIAAKKGIQLPAGAYVGRVTPYSSGALAGLRVGDVITQLNGQAVRSDEDVHSIMRGARYGQAADLLVWRNGQTIGMRVQL